MPNVPNSNLTLSNGLSFGLDYNDGKSGRGGTPTPNQFILLHGAGGVESVENARIEELPDSPIITRAEQGTSVHHFRLPWTEAKQRLTIFGRGALVMDSYNNFFRVLETSIQKQQGRLALLNITTESVSFDSPPDEWDMSPCKINVDIMKHPRYLSALMPSNQITNFMGVGDTDAQILAKQAIIRSIQAYRDNPFIPTSSNINNMVGQLHDNIAANIASGKFVVSKLNPNYKPEFKATAPLDVGASAGAPPAAASANGQPNPVTYFFHVNATSSDPNQKIAMAMAASRELIGKLWRMEDAPMVNGVEMTHTEFWFRPPPLNLGGYVEDPRLATPPVPDYFLSTAYPPNATETIFDKLSYFNPQCFSTTGKYGGPVQIAWLRDADRIGFQRTWFPVTRKWLGAVIGAWDPELYTKGNRPSVPSDYKNLLMTA